VAPGLLNPLAIACPPAAKRFGGAALSLVEPNLPARPGQGGDADKLRAAVEQPRKLRPDRLECRSRNAGSGTLKQRIVRTSATVLSRRSRR
jgi:hypothetical protein